MVVTEEIFGMVNINFLKIKTNINYFILQAFNYIYKNGIASDMNYPFYSGDINMQVYLIFDQFKLNYLICFLI